jgi:hypothetical protein
MSKNLYNPYKANFNDNDTDSDSDSDEELENRVEEIGRLLERQARELDEVKAEMRELKDDRTRAEDPFVEKERRRAFQGESTGYNDERVLNLRNFSPNIDHPFNTTNEKEAMTPVRRGGKSKRKSKRKLRKCRKSRKLKNKL